MLHLYRYGIDKVDNVKHNIDEVFDITILDGSAADRKFIEFIDNGTYVSPYEFDDRFGIRRSVDQLSTGCKIALSVYHNPGIVCNAIEAGRNALSAIIGVCKDGGVVIHDRGYTFTTRGFDDAIDVAYNGYRFTSYEWFNEYLHDYWPGEPEIVEGDGIVKLHKV